MTAHRPLKRSFDIYYRDHARTARMDALNAQFVKPGQLAFDLGAHVGDRTASFLRLGARVVAVEPQPNVFRALRLIHGRHPLVTLHRAALAAQPGRARMLLNTRNPTVSTLSSDFVTAAESADGWRDQSWDYGIDVPVLTLDQLIAGHGLPDFVKIDVEGHEAQVLHGLSTPLPALSFEVTTLQRDVGLAAIARLSALGPYTFNLTLGETHSLGPDWVSADAMSARLQTLPDSANSGDIYARVGSCW
ncbi:MAG: FkbM family methyltransferase [Pseudomonadota bacterium]